MSCRGICGRYKAKKPDKGGWYVDNKRCNHCGIFIAGRDRINCPCCRFKLRSLPRNKTYKAKFKAHRE